jgi:hypothetical protein
MPGPIRSFKKSRLGCNACKERRVKVYTHILLPPQSEEPSNTRVSAMRSTHSVGTAHGDSLTCNVVTMTSLSRHQDHQ